MSKYTVEQVAQTIDHAVLKPNFTDADLAEHAAMAVARGVKSICVRPCDVARVAQMVAGSDVFVSVVVGFPHGHNRAEVKALEAALAIADGAREIDMVMNIGRFLSGDDAAVIADIAGVVAVAHAAGALVKVIFETAYLTLDQVAHACELAEAAGADFVKTSTGFAPGSATPEIIDVMKATIGGRLKIKPSGGIRDWATAVAYLDQGVDRLGVGSTEAVLDGGAADGDY